MVAPSSGGPSDRSTIPGGRQAFRGANTQHPHTAAAPVDGQIRVDVADLGFGGGGDAAVRVLQFLRDVGGERLRPHLVGWGLG